jgi:hypothetical protein
MALRIGADRERVAAMAMAATRSCASASSPEGRVCTPYLESCPRTAPFGKAALWTFT